MVMNLGGGYPMMGGYQPINQMSMTQNRVKYFNDKYGFEVCQKKEPYISLIPKPFIPEPKESLKPTFFKRFCSKILGGWYS